MLLIVAASLASSFSTAGALSETAGKATTTMVTNANVKALTCQWSNYALESKMMLNRCLGYLLCYKDVACA